MAEYSYLKPKVGSPKMIRDQKNGQFVNPPMFMEISGAKSSRMLHRGTSRNLRMERGGPSSRKGKPI